MFQSYKHRPQDPYCSQAWCNTH